VAILPGSGITDHQGGHDYPLLSEAIGHRAELFPRLRDLAGLDVLPLLRGQAGPAGSLLNRQAMLFTPEFDLLAEQNTPDAAAEALRVLEEGGA